QWIEDRREHLMCSCHSRDQLHDVEVGFDDEGRIVALRDDFIVDCGAWNPIGAGVVYNTAVHLPGPYKIDALAIEASIAATNKVPNAPYRGAGRPEATFAMERVIDIVAGELKLEPAEVRLRNMVRADEMPYRPGIPYRDGEPIAYDGGDPRRQRAPARQSVCHRRQRTGMRRHRSRTAQWRRGHRRRARRGTLTREAGASGAAGLGSRPAPRSRCRTRGDLLLRAAHGHV